MPEPRDQEVLRLDVTMNDLVAMGGGERAGSVETDQDDLRRMQPPITGADEASDGAPRRVLHHQHRSALGVEHLLDAHHVGVALQVDQRRQFPVGAPPRSDDVAEIAKDLQRDGATRGSARCAVHVTEPTRADGRDGGEALDPKLCRHDG